MYRDKNLPLQAAANELRMPGFGFRHQVLTHAVVLCGIILGL
jgi:hypothetical protein